MIDQIKNKFTMEEVDLNIKYYNMKLIGLQHNRHRSMVKKIEREWMNWKVIKRILLHARRN